VRVFVPTDDDCQVFPGGLNVLMESGLFGPCLNGVRRRTKCFVDHMDTPLTASWAHRLKGVCKAGTLDACCATNWFNRRPLNPRFRRRGSSLRSREQVIGVVVVSDDFPRRGDGYGGSGDGARRIEASVHIAKGPQEAVRSI
jgi:hypothetical protein